MPLRCPTGEAIDLATEPGLRLWVRQDAATASVVLQFHHACCDGTGALQFTGDLLAAYGIRTASDDIRPELLPLDAIRLPLRGDFAKETPSWMGRVRHFGASLREAYRWCSRHPSPLNLPERSMETTDPAEELFSGICTSVLDKSELESLLSAARFQGVTLNDLLLCNMFLTITDWDGRYGSVRCRKWLRVAMPADLRAAEDCTMPAANRVTMSFLTRAARECLDARALLAGIRRETAHIKRTRRGLHFLKGLKAVRTVWGALPKHFTHKRCLATAVLSNMGDVETRLAARFPHTDGLIAVGDLLLREISGVPPLRHQTRAVLLVTTYAGRMTITARCDPHAFTPSQAEEFLSLYMERLRTALEDSAGG